jgi:hypothetical protein
MTRREKLFAAVRNNPRGVRFGDACKVAELLGFQRKGGEGSHVVYGRPGEPVILNLQNRSGYVYAYQVRQLIAMMDKYEGTP